MEVKQLEDEYPLLRTGKGIVWHSDRTLLRFSGPDAGKFLQNFCTADVNALPPDGICEAFVLDSRGKTISFGHLLKQGESIWWTATNRAHSESLRAHFDRYIIREDVEVEDCSEGYCAALQPNAVELKDLADHRLMLDANGVLVARGEFAGPCLLHLVPADRTTAWQSAALTDGNIECSLAALDAIRLVAGTPWFGTEVNDDNLPQEMRRDERAISFKKGCYLGQETVAKIDAIGHVNRFLVGLRIENDLLQAPSDIVADDKKIGLLKSVTRLPGIKGCLGLGFVKRQFANDGTQVQVAGATAEVVELPFSIS